LDFKLWTHIQLIRDGNSNQKYPEQFPNSPYRLEYLRFKLNPRITSKACWKFKTQVHFYTERTIGSSNAAYKFSYSALSLKQVLVMIMSEKRKPNKGQFVGAALTIKPSSNFKRA